MTGFFNPKPIKVTVYKTVNKINDPTSCPLVWLPYIPKSVEKLS